MPNPPGSFIWYELMTTDPAGAKAFYDAVVGWDIGTANAGPEGADYRMIGRGDGGMAGGVLKLDEAMTAAGARTCWMGYVGVDDVDATIAKAQAMGATVELPAFDAPGVGRIAMIADPGGVPIYLMKPTPPADKPDATSDVFSPDQQQRVGWNELGTPDPDAARHFYGALFGWESGEYMDMGENGEYRFFDHNDQRIGALYKAGGAMAPGWRYYIRVPSISAAIDAVKEGNGIVTMGPHEVPGGDHIVIGNDPQGAVFALVGKA